MAVRKIEYAVDRDKISPSVEQSAGIQGEHRATKLVFNISEELKADLEQSKGTDGREFTVKYRVDVYDGYGGVFRNEGGKGVPDNIEFYLEEGLTRYGGKLTVYLIFTIIDQEENDTEMELYSFPAFLRLKSLPDAVEKEAENYESMTTLAEFARNSMTAAQQSENAAKESADAAFASAGEAATSAAAAKASEDAVVESGTAAREALEKSELALQKSKEADSKYDACVEATENANAVREKIEAGGYIKSLKELNKGAKFTTWIGTEEEYNAQTNNGEDPIPNCLYLTQDDAILKELLSRDYIVKQDTELVENDGATWNWNYEKWNSGKSVAWCNGIPFSVAENSPEIYETKVYYPSAIDTSIMRPHIQVSLWCEDNHSDYITSNLKYHDGDGWNAFNLFIHNSGVYNATDTFRASAFIIGRWK